MPTAVAVELTTLVTSKARAQTIIFMFLVFTAIKQLGKGMLWSKTEAATNERESWFWGGTRPRRVGSQTRRTLSLRPDALWMPFVRQERFHPERLKVGALAAIIYHDILLPPPNHAVSSTPLLLSPSNVLLPFDFSTSRTGMMCRFHFGSSLLLVFCCLVASFELTTAVVVRRSAASIPTHFRCARWTFELTLESDLQQRDIFNHRKRWYKLNVVMSTFMS